MMHRSSSYMRHLVLALLVGAPTALAFAAPVVAQGVVSVQGFGYPPGQLSAGALGIGGAAAESDASSGLNPAALGTVSRFAIYAHYQPEFRRTTADGATATSRAVRFPGFTVTGGRGRFTTSLSFSTLLDRTWANSYSDSQVVGGETVPSTLRASSDGAINDSRFALAYVVNQRFQVGIALHALSGENRILFGRTFPESLGIGAVSQFSTMSYSGRTYSTGMLFQPTPKFVLGASARFGGEIDVDQSGEPVASADVPSRIGVGVSYLGIPNTVIAARIDRTTWSDLAPLGTTATSAFDATEFALGAESVGPRINGVFSTLRLGYRNRTLPFGLDGDRISERAFTGGVGIPLSRGRSQVDLTAQRAARSGGGASEKAWVLSVGLGIRP
jgi:hypothetical protein